MAASEEQWLLSTKWVHARARARRCKRQLRSALESSAAAVFYDSWTQNWERMRRKRCAQSALPPSKGWLAKPAKKNAETARQPRTRAQNWATARALPRRVTRQLSGKISASNFLGIHGFKPEESKKHTIFRFFKNIEKLVHFRWTLLIFHNFQSGHSKWALFKYSFQIKHYWKVAVGCILDGPN